jgi:hypothetical protein
MSQTKELYVAFGEAVGAGERSLGKRLTEGENRLAWEFFLAGADFGFDYTRQPSSPAEKEVSHTTIAKEFWDQQY